MDSNAIRLQRYLETGRIPPVLIFIGEDGAGRKGVAYQFADKARGDCPVEVVQGDVFFSVDAARTLVTPLKVAAGSRRFIIVEDLDNASTNALNALLKALEQPPPRTHFILIASGRGVITTIKSRGVLFYFKSADSAYLLKKVDAEPLCKLVWGKLGGIDREFLLAVSEGSWGRLHSLLSNDSALKLLLGLVHNFTVPQIKTETFKQIKGYTQAEKESPVPPLASIFRLLLEQDDLVYSKRLTRNLKKLDRSVALGIVEEAGKISAWRERCWEFLYLSTH